MAIFCQSTADLLERLPDMLFFNPLHLQHYSITLSSECQRFLRSGDALGQRLYFTEHRFLGIIFSLSATALNDLDERA